MVLPPDCVVNSIWVNSPEYDQAGFYLHNDTFIVRIVNKSENLRHVT